YTAQKLFHALMFTSRGYAPYTYVANVSESVIRSTRSINAYFPPIARVAASAPSRVSNTWFGMALLRHSQGVACKSEAQVSRTEIKNAIRINFVPRIEYYRRIRIFLISY